MYTRVLLLITIIYLSGCATSLKSTWYQDVADNPQTVELQDDAIKQKVNYLSRFIMEPDDRTEFLSDLNKSKLTKGAVGSAEDSKQDSSVVTASQIRGEVFDGSMDIVSQAWLPESIDNEKIVTKRQANKMLSRIVTNKVKNIAENMQLNVRCITNCGTGNQIFYLTRKKGIKNPGYIYWPRDVIIMTNVQGVVKADENDLTSEVLGYPVKWKTPGGDTFVVSFLGDAYFNAEGVPKIRKNRETNLFVPSAKRNLLKTRYGRDMMRHFHNDKYSFFGTSETHPKEVVFNGEIYSFNQNGTKDLIKNKLAEKPFSSK